MTTAIPELRRLRYFHGQLLSAHDFQREQDYFREKLKLRNRCLHGFGVACGLEIRPVPPEHPCDPAPAPEPAAATRPKGRQGKGHNAQAQQAQEGEAQQAPPSYAGQPRVRLEAGVAIDCLGNELVVAHHQKVDLLRALSPEDRSRFHDGDTLYLSIRYHDRPVERTRGVFTDGCGNTADCEYGWSKDDYLVGVTLREPPPHDECADPCCVCCDDPRVLLARIDDVHQGRPLGEASIHMEVRRPLSRYRFTTISGISWVHDGSYTRAQARQVLGSDDSARGLVVRFSAPVRSSTLRDGVVDLLVYQGGKGRAGYTYFMDSRIAPPAGDYTRELRFRQTSEEGLERNDRVLIIVRSAFILDRCCRPVDGTHVGGRVPLLAGSGTPGPPPADCPAPPGGVGPWTSGTGVGGDVFESWFYVREGAASA